MSSRSVSVSSYFPCATHRQNDHVKTPPNSQPCSRTYSELSTSSTPPRTRLYFLPPSVLCGETGTVQLSQWALARNGLSMCLSVPSGISLSGPSALLSFGVVRTSLPRCYSTGSVPVYPRRCRSPKNRAQRARGKQISTRLLLDRRLSCRSETSSSPVLSLLGRFR